MEDPRCKICRRYGEKLFLKGNRCNTPKCAMVRKAYPPGVHGQKRRSPVSEYGRQLKEKQKLREIYGINERQFRKYFKKAFRKKGVTTEILLETLERRLDNVVFRLGLADSRKEARMFVAHGHFLVNGRKVDIPSLGVKMGDMISLRAESLKLKHFKNIKKIIKEKTPPAWLKLDADKLQAEVLRSPSGNELLQDIDMQLIVEYYSR